jgi:hypothetical protein
MIVTETHLIKDISIFMSNRNLEDIIIIDTQEERVDLDFLSTITPLTYDGSWHYS